MSIEVELAEFIAAEGVIDPSVDVSVDESLMRSGRVDSMGLLKILGFIQQRYGVDLIATCGANDFETVAALAIAIRRSRGEP